MTTVTPISQQSPQWLAKQPAASIAALTIYDMCKSVDRTMTLGPARLLEKRGGKSGHFLAE